MVRAIRYRVGQFLQALGSAVTMTTGVPEEEVKQAMSILPPEAQEIFHRQAIQDQRHGLAVYRSLCRAGHTNPELLAAGLLHDTGKVAARLPS